jgi:hypothetical protein
MNAVFTFKLSDLIAGVTRSNQWEWHGTCEAEFMARWNADLAVEPISECNLISLHIISNFDKQPAAQQLQEELLAAQTNGTTDATIVRKYEEKTLGVTLACDHTDMNSFAHSSRTLFSPTFSKKWECRSNLTAAD